MFDDDQKSKWPPSKTVATLYTTKVETSTASLRLGSINLQYLAQMAPGDFKSGLCFTSHSITQYNTNMKKAMPYWGHQFGQIAVAVD